MRIVQLLPSFAYGDAIGNDVCAINTLLQELGYKTWIYAERIHAEPLKRIASLADDMPVLDKEDIILYHCSIGTELNYMLPKYNGRKVMIYHNITPPSFFEYYSYKSFRNTADGIRQIKYLSDKLDYCIAVSDFNRQELLDMGYTCPIDVCPILIPFSDYEKKPSRKVLSRYKRDDITNLLFVGRVSPNKKQEDVIAAFYCYHKYYNRKSRLFLVGSADKSYYNQLHGYVSRLGLEGDVIFTGRVGFDEMLAYYRLADVFVCMSEHEGFCVPLVEAMYFDKPIVAYKSTAIPYTMGNQGILLDSKEPEYVAAVIDRVMKDSALRKEALRLQRERLKDFSYDRVRQQLTAIINKIINI